MPFLFVTQEQAEMLRSIVKAWPRLGPRLDTLLAMIEPKAVELRASSAPRTAPAAEVPTLPGGGWFKIKSSSSIGTNQWNYKGRLMKSGDTTEITGLVETSDTTEFDLRNAFEQLPLGGLTGVSSLVAIANDSPVYALPEIRDNKRIFVFREQNDINCTAARPGEILGPTGVTTVSSDTTLDDTMYDITVESASGDVTLSLPSAVTLGAYEYWIDNQSGHNVIIDPDGSETIDGISTLTIPDGDYVRIRSDGATWTAT